MIVLIMMMMVVVLNESWSRTTTAPSWTHELMRQISIWDDGWCEEFKKSVQPLCDEDKASLGEKKAISYVPSFPATSIAFSRWRGSKVFFIIPSAVIYIWVGIIRFIIAISIIVLVGAVRFAIALIGGIFSGLFGLLFVRPSSVAPHFIIVIILIMKSFTRSENAFNEEIQGSFLRILGLSRRGIFQGICHGVEEKGRGQEKTRPVAKKSLIDNCTAATRHRSTPPGTIPISGFCLKFRKGYVVVRCQICRVDFRIEEIGETKASFEGHKELKDNGPFDDIFELGHDDLWVVI